MGSTRRSYTPEYKAQSVAFVLDGGRPVAEVGWADSGDYPVSFMCAWLGVSRSGYDAWRGAEPSQRSKDDSALIAVMRKIL